MNAINPSSRLSVLNHLFQRLPLAAAVLDEQGQWQMLNAAFEQFLGVDHGVLPPGVWLDQLADREAMPSYWADVVADRQDRVSFPALWRRSDQLVRGGEVQLQHLDRDEEGQRLVLMTVEDVTARLPGERSHPLQFDHLTGLVTNALFLDRLQQALVRLQRHGGELAILMLDLDGFKAVNERYGVGKGDEVLREVGLRLRQCVRRSDTLARLDSDEFGLILEEVGSSLEAMTIAAKVCDMMLRPFDGVELKKPLTASVGIAMADRETDAWGLLRRADQSMYRAKASAPGTYQLWP